ncbi:MAG: Uma2 family endonuclease [Pseudomonadota bacterium]|nr:Uma2 family endonuclease [Pseudomonadota bacterium]
MGLPQIKSEDKPRYTYADYLSWQGDERYQLIEGDAFLMAPAPAVRHQAVVMEVASQAHVALKGTPCQVFTAPLDVRLLNADKSDDQIDTVVQPDVLAVCDPRKVDERGIRGAPDWVVEVLSPFTAGLDHVKKRRLYEQAGVREYWLIQPMDRVLTVYTLKDGAYGRPHIQELEGETPVGVLEGVAIQWDELAARLPPPEF